MSEKNPNSRLEAFCDGVFAIALTLLVIDIKFPDANEVTTNAAFWHSFKHIAPSIFSFILSFMIILITWVNHHNSLNLVGKSSTSFFYANGFMLLTVVFVPFPTSLLGEYLLTENASPAVVLYNSVWVMQAISWIFLCNESLKRGMPKNENAAKTIRNNRKFAVFALVLYSTFAIIAIWLPVTIAVLTLVTWVFWLIYGTTIKQNQGW